LEPEGGVGPAGGPALGGGGEEGGVDACGSGVPGWLEVLESVDAPGPLPPHAVVAARARKRAGREADLIVLSSGAGGRIAPIPSTGWRAEADRTRRGVDRQRLRARIAGPADLQNGRGLLTVRWRSVGGALP
jgi:hypothetical protein